MIKKSINFPTLKKLLPLAICLLIFGLAHSQNLQWLQTSTLPEYTQTEAIRVSPTGSVYLCTARDSLGVKAVSSIQKLSSSGVRLWTNTLRGQVMFTDLQVAGSGNILVCGAYKNNIQLGNTSLSGSATLWSGFVAMADTNGNFAWAKKIALPNKSLIPRSMNPERNGSFFMACEGTPANSFGVSAYKMDLAGNILSTKIINNDGGSVSHIITDATGNIYLTGTCSGLASFDGNPSQLPGVDYQSMLLKYNPNFQFQWVRNRRHVTQDLINKIGVAGNKVFWCVVDYNQGIKGTRKLIRFDTTGSPEDSLQQSIPSADGGRPVFSMAQGGRGLLAYNIGPRFVFNVVDTGLNIVWKDSTNVVGSLDQYPLAVDMGLSSMVFSAAHNADTLRIAGKKLGNPNAGGMLLNSDVFVAYWSAPVATFMRDKEKVSVKLPHLYPNPTTAYLWIKNTSASATIICSDAAGKHLFVTKETNYLNVQALPAGQYFLRIQQEADGQEQVLRFEKY